jgi:hypothetical protein
MLASGMLLVHSKGERNPNSHPGSPASVMVVTTGDERELYGAVMRIRKLQNSLCWEVQILATGRIDSAPGGGFPGSEVWVGLLTKATAGERP